MSILTVPTTPKVYSAAITNLFTVLPTPPEDEMSLEERVTFFLVGDLARLGWRLKPCSQNSFEFVPPTTYNKDVVKKAMAYARNDVLSKQHIWIQKHLPMAQKSLASGRVVLTSQIRPRIEVCTHERQHDLFRLFRYYWSSPYSEYVGRRLRLLIRDDGIKDSPVIGIAALGSSIIHIPDRDKWIGWETKTRTDRIVYIMDAYVVGALPPYNYLLGGKLVAYILASNEVRDIYKQKYVNQKTLIKERQADNLVLIVTSSLYGKNSSQYNRLKYNDDLLYQPIGATEGFGTLHISSQTFAAMKALVESKGISISYKFGDGPNWRMRVIRAACDSMGLDGEIILRHSFQRGLYALPLAENWKSFLLGDAEMPVYKNMPLEKLVEYWKERWLRQRLGQPDVVNSVQSFIPDQFNIEPTKLNFSESQKLDLA